MRESALPIGIRKAQVFTICTSGLGLPIRNYGKPTPMRKPHISDYCPFTFRGPNSRCK